MQELTNEEIEARIKAVAEARHAKGHMLTEDEFTAIVGPPVERVRARGRKLWQGRGRARGRYAPIHTIGRD